MAESGAIVPHVLLVSYPAQGHVNPLLRLAKRIAAKGLLVTFSSTLDIGRRILASTKTPSSFNADAPIPIGNGHLRFEFFSDGLPDNDPRRFNIFSNTHQLRTVGSSALAVLIRRQADRGRPVSCVVNNPFVPWVLDVAEELRIPSAVLWIQSSAVFSCYYHYFHSLAEFPSVKNPDVAVSIPGLPTLKPDELPTFLASSSPYKPVLTEVILSQFRNIHKATWVLANTFDDLEHDAIKSIPGHSPVIPVGPLVDDSESDVKGDLWKAAEHCMEWLDQQEPNSVVYVSLGSIASITEYEMAEMANGLLNCGRPFLWALRDNCRDLLPWGFSEKAKGKGMVISWSPQERVLSHGSVACFVTHCGWNSTLEAMTGGVPVVAYPQWGDQVPDSKFMADVWGVGVRLEAPMRREELEKCVVEVTEGAKAERIRERAAEWKEAARKAVAEGGSSDRNVQAFVDEIVRRSGGEISERSRSC